MVDLEYKTKCSKWSYWMGSILLLSLKYLDDTIKTLSNIFQRFIVVKNCNKLNNFKQKYAIIVA